MTVPAAATKVNLDQASDDPKQARAELADHIDKFNTLRSHVLSSPILSTPLNVGDGLEAASGNLRTKINGTSIKRDMSGLSVQFPAESKAGAFTVQSADRGKAFDCSGTFTATLTAAATLGDGFYFSIRNGGSGTVTLDPNAAELIDGAATLALAGGQSAFVFCTGSAWFTVGLGGSGKIGQVVNTQDGAVATGTTTIPADDTIPQNTEGDEYMTLAITPQNASSILIIEVVGSFAHSLRKNMGLALFKDSDASALAGMRASAEQLVFNMSMTHRMTAGTTSAMTFKLRAGSSGSGTTTFNGVSGGRIFGGVMASSITITEVLP